MVVPSKCVIVLIYIFPYAISSKTFAKGHVHGKILVNT